MRIVFLTLFTAWFVTSAYAQFTPKNEVKLKRKIEREQRKLDRTYGLIVLPALYYTPETNLAGGITGMFTFKSNPKDTACRTSQIFANAIYTLNDQIILAAPFQVFLSKNKWFLNGELSFFRYPYIYGGIGNDHEPDEYEDYNAYFPRYRAEILRRVADNIYMGGNLFYQNTTITEKAFNGLLDTGTVAGAQGGVTFGLGISILYDSRNNQLSPTKGWYLSYSTLHNNSAWGSDFNFDQYTLDARFYHPFKKRHGWAHNVYAQFQNGTVPFNRLSALGGPFRMRGYQQAVYRDENQVVYQTEFRSKVYFNHVAFRLFSAVGGIGSDLEEISQNLRPTLGTGIRFTFNKKSKVFIRLDYGVGIGTQTSGFYVNVGEAF